MYYKKSRQSLKIHFSLLLRIRIVREFKFIRKKFWFRLYFSGSNLSSMYFYVIKSFEEKLNLRYKMNLIEK